MRVAFLADIHGNIHALEAVLKDAQKQSVEKIFCCGDLVGYGPHPEEVIRRVRADGILCVGGHYDYAVAKAQLPIPPHYLDERMQELEESGFVWTTERISPELVEWLRNLPGRLPCAINGRRVIVCHGSPRDTDEPVFHHSPDCLFANLAQEAGSDMIVMGHIHCHYHRIASRTHFVNVGTVGKPITGDPRAGYAVLDIDNLFEGVYRRVEYDVDAAVRDLRASGLPEEFAERLQKGI